MRAVDSGHRSHNFWEDSVEASGGRSLVKVVDGACCAVSERLQAGF